MLIPFQTAAGVSATAIALGSQHTCAIEAGGGPGGVKCWGWNGRGQLGIGWGTDNQTSPVAVPGARGEGWGRGHLGMQRDVLVKKIGRKE